MTRENVMSTPIFDQLLREMAQRAEPRATTQEQVPQEPQQQAPTSGRRRHRAE
jgi:hypothetical protein